MVPPYSVYLESVPSAEYTSYLEKGNWFLITGVLSPVSMLSFIMHWPVKRIKSHGMDYFSGISMTSPGTSHVLSI